jgi:two-component system phosphate regulon sensor histidine kinase PhoR
MASDIAADEIAALYDEAQRTSALLDALYGAAPVGLGFWDRDLRYVRVNDALARINERSAEDHVGRTIAEVIPHLADEVETLVRGVLESGEALIELQITGGTPSDPEEVRHWSASYYPVVGADGELIGVGAVIEETTERRRAEQRTALQHEVTRVLADADSTDGAFASVLEQICATLGWEVACHWSTDPEVPRVVWSLPGVRADGFLALTERAVLSLAMLPGRVAASGVTEWLVDLEPSHFPRAPVAVAEGLRSGVAFAVIVDGAVDGVIEMFSRARRPVDDDLVASLEALGGQLGQFLRRKRAEEERGQLLQRERQARAAAEAAAATLRKLERVADAALPQLGLKELLAALLRRIVEVLEGDAAVILLLEDDDRLHIRGSVGLEPELDDVPLPVGAGLSGRVAASREPMLVADLAQAELASPVLIERGINSLVAIPILAEEHLVGVVHVCSRAYAQFAEEDVRLLALIADRIGLAIDQATLREAEQAAQREAETARDRLGFLAEASALLGSSLDVERTLEQLATLVEGRVADRCTIDLGDEHGDEESAGETILVLPLHARGRTFGTMTLESARPFAADDVGVARDLARRASVAIDNAQLYSAAAERAQAARVLASVGDGVFLVDRAGFVRTWNRAAAAATGLPAADVVDRLAVSAIPGWSSIVPRITVTPAGSSSPRPESLPLDLGARELWLSIHGVAVPDGVVYAFRDLTEERALEQMRTEFVSTVSHELRTPLAAIYGAAMTLRRSDVALDEGQRATLLDVVSGEADRLARTVNDILWASRLDTDSLHVEIQNCDPLTLVQDVLQAQEVHLDRSHELVLEAADGLPLVSGDPDKVGRVLINLVDNAIKYSPDGGRVTVSVVAAGAHVRFSVSDQGLGIPPGEQRRVFEKFYRLDPQMNRGVGGTGLGLYICRELVRRMDGRVWVDSDGVGRGSTFSVELPAVTYEL